MAVKQCSNYRGDGGDSPPPLGFSVTPTICVLGIPEGDRICLFMP